MELLNKFETEESNWNSTQSVKLKRLQNVKKQTKNLNEIIVVQLLSRVWHFATL